MDEKELMEKVKNLYLQDAHTQTQYAALWMEEIVFSWRWWVSLFLTLLPWIVWAVYCKKDSVARLIGVGFFTMFLTAWLDSIGVPLGLWYYPVDIIPFFPSYIPYDFCIFPVLIMILLQFKPRVSPYWKALAFAAGTAFIAEPVMEYFDFYEEIRWNSFLSAICYFIIYLLAHWLNSRTRYQPVE
ncbi:CBO0543 family protein [Paenibacillus tarimensis]